jgi:hypothetical protein
MSSARRFGMRRWRVAIGDKQWHQCDSSADTIFLSRLQLMPATAAHFAFPPMTLLEHRPKRVFGHLFNCLELKLRHYRNKIRFRRLAHKRKDCQATHTQDGDDDPDDVGPSGIIPVPGFVFVTVCIAASWRCLAHRTASPPVGSLLHWVCRHGAPPRNLGQRSLRPRQTGGTFVSVYRSRIPHVVHRFFRCCDDCKTIWQQPCCR